MNIKSYLFLTLLSICMLSACTKDDEDEQAPVVKMNIENSPINGKVNEKIAFSALNVNNKVYDQEWKLSEQDSKEQAEVVSNTSTYDFTPKKAGIYNIDYTATNSSGTFNYKYVVNVGVPTIPANPGSKAYVTRMFEFLPAPGQFINTTLGTIEAAKSLEGKQGAVSLGAWGGYIVLGFDHSVINEPNKEDVIIYGNAITDFSEPGVVWVMQDKNGNGLPDDTWYELKGSEYNKPGYISNYEVTYTKPAAGGNVSWKDNQGNTGTVNVLNAAFQSYPSWITTNEYTLKGSLLPSSGIKFGDIVTSAPFEFGYADNTVGGDKIDIANAIDQDGKPVSLGTIDFIKIQTGVQANLGLLGEFSTEVLGVADISLLSKK